MRAFMFFCSATGQPASSPAVLPPSWLRTRRPATDDALPASRRSTATDAARHDG